MLIPMVVDQTTKGERSYDIYSRLLEDRIIFLTGAITAENANTIIAQMIFLEGKDPNKDIYLYINSPGGEANSAFAILDTMNYIKCDVSTICMGLAASAGSLLLCAGAKGKRFSLPNAEIMIHQPWIQGIGGQITDLGIKIKQLDRQKTTYTQVIADCCGKSFEQVKQDMERDNWMTPSEAKKYGLIDKIFVSRDKEINR